MNDIMEEQERDTLLAVPESQVMPVSNLSLAK